MQDFGAPKSCKRGGLKGDGWLGVGFLAFERSGF